MFKKLISGVAAIALVAITLPLNAVAATVEAQLYDLEVLVGTDGSTAALADFNPTEGEELTVNIDFTKLNSSATTSNGTISIVQRGASSGSDVTVHTIANWADALPNNSENATWNGKVNDDTTAANNLCTDSSTACNNGEYSVKVAIDDEMGTNDVSYIDFTIVDGNTLAIESVTLSADFFDPAPSGADEAVQISYVLNQSDSSTSVLVEIQDDQENVLDDDVFAGESAITGSFTWDGEFGSTLVEPGTYNVIVTASQTNETEVVSTTTVEVIYNDSDRPNIDNLEVSPDEFDPDERGTTISFDVEDDANIEVDVRQKDGTPVFEFTQFDGEEDFAAGASPSDDWDGQTTGNNDLPNGDYDVVVVARNNSGVTVTSTNVTINDNLNSASDENAHIKNISFSPSTFEPAEDDEITIEFDIEEDDIDLVITARRGTDVIEIFDEDNLDEETNFEVEWDGTDDDGEYLEEGTWTIRFESRQGSVNLVAEDTIRFEYEKPIIDDLYLSKDEFDPEQGEFTHIIFRVDTDAEVDIFVLEDNDEDDEIVEDFDVEADRWYAVEWDGGSYDEDDDLDIKVVAKNIAFEEVFDTDTISVDIEEDDASSSKANIVNDFITPVITDGDSEMTIFFELEDDADLEVSIHRGTSSSGSTEVTLVDQDDVSSGSKEIVWDGKRSGGSDLRDGVYTYSIESRLRSTEKETGLFVVGNIGDIDGSGSGGSSSNGGRLSSGVTIVGADDDDDDEPEPTTPSSDCGDFSDVSSSSKYCDAVDWAESQGIVNGYSDGTFRPNQPINRVEALKMIFESYDTVVFGSDGSNLGFVDVEPSAWYMPYIRTGQQLGVFNGDGNGQTARPGDTVNRVEALKMAIESAGVLRGFNVGSCGSTGFADVASSAWYAPYVCVSDDYDLIDVFGSIFGPGTLSTRGEVILMLYRMDDEGLL